MNLAYVVKVNKSKKSRRRRMEEQVFEATKLASIQI